MFKTLIILVVLLMAVPVSAEPVQYLFKNATSSVTGDARRGEAKDHTVDCVFTNTTGTVSALSIQLLGSLDQSNYDVLATHAFTARELSAGKHMFHISDKQVSSVKGSTSVLTKSGDIDLSCTYKAHRFTR